MVNSYSRSYFDGVLRLIWYEMKQKHSGSLSGRVEENKIQTAVSSVCVWQEGNLMELQFFESHSKGGAKA